MTEENYFIWENISILYDSQKKILFKSTISEIDFFFFAVALLCFTNPLALGRKRRQYITQVPEIVS